jgi:drug/metabolite transporter (DMT)-like permease
MSARALFLLIVLAALWGGSFVFTRFVVPALGPFPLTFARVALAALALLMFVAAQHALPDLRTHWRGLAVVGLVNSALPFALFAFGAQFLTASTCAILNATAPFFVALAAAFWLGEPLSARKTTGMAMGLAGVVVLVGWSPEPITSTMLIAIAACLAASICYALGGVYTKRRMQRASSLTLACGSQLAAAIILLPALPASAVPGPVTAWVAACVVALAVACTALAYLIYFRLIADVGPTRALTVTFLIPLFGVLWGWLFLGEAITANMLVGGVLIVAGTWLALRGNAPTASVPAKAAHGSS